jgi:hypothetical protein
MRRVFDQHTEMDRNGNVRGGDGKHSFLHNRELDNMTMRTLVNTPCRLIIETLRSLFCELNYFAKGEDDFGSAISVLLESARQQAAKKLNSSEWILEMFNKHLTSEWDVDDDGSLHLHKAELRRDPAASRNRRKREGIVGQGDDMTPDQRRMGRLPPRAAESSRSIVWSQGTHPQSNTRSETLLGSTSQSATRATPRKETLRAFSRAKKAASGGK